MRERMRACCEEVNKSACDIHVGERRDQGDGAREERDNTHRTLLEMRRGERETANTQPHSQLSPACEEGGMQKEAQHTVNTVRSEHTSCTHAVPSRSLSPTCMKKPRRRRPLLVTPPPPVNDWGVHVLRRRPRDTTARRKASMVVAKAVALDRICEATTV